MRHSRISLPLLLFVTAFAGTRDAGAAPKRRYAIRDLRIEGASNDEEKRFLIERLWTAMELVFNNKGHVLLPADEVEKQYRARADLRACHQKRCNLLLGDLLNAQR